MSVAAIIDVERVGTFPGTYSGTMNLTLEGMTWVGTDGAYSIDYNPNFGGNSDVIVYGPDFDLFNAEVAGVDQTYFDSPFPGEPDFTESGTVTITGYPPESTIAVPDVVGMAQTDAVTAIENASLNAGTVTTQYSSVDAGKVISQDPIAGTEVAADTDVNLTVSLGMPPKATNPTPANGITGVLYGTNQLVWSVPI
ncbi:MAG: PASTA domain-containing protein [Sedimentisphaerales bacterium]|jgi:hypothetical protein